MKTYVDEHGYEWPVPVKCKRRLADGVTECEATTTRQVCGVLLCDEHAKEQWPMYPVNGALFESSPKHTGDERWKNYGFSERLKQEQINLFGVCYEWHPPDGTRWIVPMAWVTKRFTDGNLTHYEVRENGGSGASGILKLPPEEVTEHGTKPPPSGRRLAIMRVSNAAWRSLDLCNVQEAYEGVSYSYGKAAHIRLGLPDDCRVDAISYDHFFAHDAVALRLESPDFREVEECRIIPEVEAVYGVGEGVGTFLGWRGGPAVLEDSPRRYVEIPETAMTDEMVDAIAERFRQQYQGPREEPKSLTWVAEADCPSLEDCQKIMDSVADMVHEAAEAEKKDEKLPRGGWF